jgi:O-antigen biosynthesis protein
MGHPSTAIPGTFRYRLRAWLASLLARAPVALTHVRMDVDTPASGQVVPQSVFVSGWAFSPNAEIVAVEAWFDGRCCPLRYGAIRPDVVRGHRRCPTDRCGFSAFVPVPASHRRWSTLVIVAHDSRGRLAAQARRVRTARPPSATLAPEPSTGLAEARRFVTSLSTVALTEFLTSGARLTFRPPADAVEVSVLIALHNRAELTLRCLRALSELGIPPMEIILVDNASQDETGNLLERLDGVRLLLNAKNVGYLRAVNQAAAVARGRALLFLNNDVELLPGSVAAALSTLDSIPSAGVVGGRLILPDGHLQEAGSIIWRDGSCQGYGRGEDLTNPAYLFQRDVDFCSGAFLLTPRALWERLGGFDSDYAPAYYEDADYCARVWQSGRRVIYEPRAVGLHFEFASATSPASAVKKQDERRGLFVRKHAAWLACQPVRETTSLLAARTARGGGARVLILDDRVPHARHGAGCPRAKALLESLVRLGWEVTFAPLADPHEAWASAYSDIPRTIEVLLSHGSDGLLDHLRERGTFYRCILISRPHNMDTFAAARDRLGPTFDVPVVYDAEAIFADRDVAARRLRGELVSDAELTSLRARELSLVEGAAAVLAVSAADAARMSAVGVSPLFVVGHALEPQPTPSPFEARDGFLFVGAMGDEAGPNVDSIRWFIREVLPRLCRRMGRSPRLDIVGTTARSVAQELAGPFVRFHGNVAELRELYGKARVFVAPTRFAAGIPLKVYEASAYGVPVVATTLVADQLGWKSECELLAAGSAEGFAEACVRLHEEAASWSRARNLALGRVARDCSPRSFEEQLAQALAVATGFTAVPLSTRLSTSSGDVIRDENRPG